MHDKCKLAEDEGYEVKLHPSNHIWYLYDVLSHAYTFGIQYCPFCGVKL
jgi:hypothetical protein